VDDERRAGKLRSLVKTYWLIEASLLELYKIKLRATHRKIAEKANYRRCPKLMPSLSAFWRSEPSVRFVNLTIFETGVRAFE
jgi:hypothetical protein